MDDQTLERRAEIARRLKAARWLAGSHRENQKGRTGRAVESLSLQDLADREQLTANGITATLLGAIERMERHTPPMELHAIAEALGLPRSWFEIEPGVPDEDAALSDAEVSRAAALLAPQLLAAARARRQAQAPTRRDEGAQGQ